MRKNKSLPGYMIDLGDEMNVAVGFQNGNSITLWQVNARESACLTCRQLLKAGAGVRLKDGRKRGFICLTCAKKLIMARGPRGYTIAFDRLQACLYDIGRFSAAQVAANIERNPYVY